jgi:thioredoxin 1
MARRRPMRDACCSRLTIVLTMPTPVTHPEPTRAEIDALRGPVLVEFGASWCGHCRAVQRPLATALGAHPNVRHIRIEDGSGRPLGRSFGVRLWPTLVFLRDGSEIERLVRPGGESAIADALARIDR